MIKLLISYSIKVVVTILLLIVIICFVDACINGPGTPGEGDTASQQDLILFYGFVLLLWIPISIGLWKIANLVKGRNK